MPSDSRRRSSSAEIWTPLGNGTSARRRPDERRHDCAARRRRNVRAGEQRGRRDHSRACARAAADTSRVDRRPPHVPRLAVRHFRAPLNVLFCGVLVLLLIASCNIASLTLAHVTSRSGELALRRAIGATRWSLARLVLLEIAILNASACGPGNRAPGCCRRCWRSRRRRPRCSAR